MKRTSVRYREEVHLESAALTSSNAVIGSQARLAQRPYIEQDTCWCWFVCLCSAIANIVVIGFSYCFGIVFPVLLEYFKQGRATTAWVGSLFMSISFLLGPVSSTLCDRYGCRVIAIGGAILCIVGLVLTSQATSIYYMYLTLSLIVGFGSCCVYTACFIVIPRLFLKHRSLAYGLISQGPAGGNAILAPIIQTLMDNFGWRNTFLVMAGIASVLCVLCWSFDSGTIYDQEVSKEEENNSRNNSGFDTSIFSNQEFMLTQLSAFVIFFGSTNVQMFLAEFCGRHGIKKSKVSILYLCFGIMTGFSRLVTGKVCDSPRLRPAYVIVFSALMAGSTVVVLPFLKAYKHMIIFALIYGIFEGSLVVSMLIATLRPVTNRQQSSAFGIWLAVSAVSIAAAPPLVGFLVDKYDSYAPGFYTSGTCIIIGGLILLLPIPLTNQRRDQPNSGSTSTVETVDDYDVDTDVVLEKLSVV